MQLDELSILFSIPEVLTVIYKHCDALTCTMFLQVCHLFKSIDRYQKNSLPASRVVKCAIRNDCLSIFRYVTDLKYPLPKNMNSILPSSLSIVSYLHSSNYKFGEDIIMHAAVIGQLDVVRYLYKTGYNINLTSNQQPTLLNIVDNGHLHVLKWLKEHSNSNRWNDTLDITRVKIVRQYPCNILPLDLAIFNGHFELFKWLLDNGCKWYNSYIVTAARTGKVDLVRWCWNRRIVEPNYRTTTTLTTDENKRLSMAILTEEICRNAAISGNLEMLEWALDICHTLDVDIEMDAAIGGNVNCLSLLYDRGYMHPTNGSPIYLHVICGIVDNKKSEVGYINVFEWLRDHNFGLEGNYYDSALAEVQVSGCILLYRWLLSNRRMRGSGPIDRHLRSLLNCSYRPFLESVIRQCSPNIVEHIVEWLEIERAFISTSSDLYTDVMSCRKVSKYRIYKLVTYLADSGHPLPSNIMSIIITYDHLNILRWLSDQDMIPNDSNYLHDLNGVNSNDCINWLIRRGHDIVSTCNESRRFDVENAPRPCLDDI